MDSNDNAPTIIGRELLPKFRKLDAMEMNWRGDQNQVHNTHLLSQTDKKSQQNYFVDTLLVKCKLHGGPVTNAEEIAKISENKS